jgi:hypothetical protein
MKLLLCSFVQPLVTSSLFGPNILVNTLFSYTYNLSLCFDHALIYELFKLKFSIILLKIINSSLSQRKFRVSVEGEISPQRDIQAGVPQGSVLSPTQPSRYMNDTPQTPDVYLALFADDTCIYATDRKEGHTIRKLQRGLSAIEAWGESWNLKISRDKTQIIYFAHRLRLPEAHLILNGQRSLLSIMSNISV